MPLNKYLKYICVVSTLLHYKIYLKKINVINRKLITEKND